MTEDFHMHDSVTSGPQMMASDQASVGGDWMDVVEDSLYARQRDILVSPSIAKEQQLQVELSPPDGSQLYTSHRSPQRPAFTYTSSRCNNATTPDHYPGTMRPLDKVLFQLQVRSKNMSS